MEFQFLLPKTENTGERKRICGLINGPNENIQRQKRGKPHMLLGAGFFNKWPSIKFRNNIETKLVISFLQNLFHIKCMTKTVRTNNNPALRFKKIWNLLRTFARSHCRGYSFRVLQSGWSHYQFKHLRTAFELNCETVRG